MFEGLRKATGLIVIVMTFGQLCVTYVSALPSHIFHNCLHMCDETQPGCYIWPHEYNENREVHHIHRTNS